MALAQERDSAQALLKTAEIEFPGGSRIIAIPANPNTARGYSANLTLDEFAFHEQPDAIWRAIYPSISNPLKGRSFAGLFDTHPPIDERIRRLREMKDKE